MTQFLQLLLLIVGVRPGCSSHEPPPYASKAAVSGSLSSREDMLSNWLWNFSVALPDINETAGGFEITLKETTCTHFEIISITSVASTVPEMVRDDLQVRAECVTPYYQEATVNVTIGGVGFQCSGVWRYEAENGIHWPSATGTLGVQVVNSQAAASILVATSDDFPGWPAKADLQGCVTLLDISLSFGGASISAKILELLQGAISRALSSTLNDEVCGWIETLVVNGLTRALRVGDSLLQSCIQSCHSSDYNLELSAADAASLEGVFDWNGAQAIHSLFAVASELATCALRSRQSLKLLGISSTSTFRLGNFGNITFAIQNVSAKITANDAKATFHTAQNASLTAAVDLPGWTNLSLGIKVVASPSDGQPFEESILLGWDIFDTIAMTTFQLAIVPSSLSSLSLGAIANTPAACAVRAVVAANDTIIRASSRTYGPPKLSTFERSGSLQEDIDQAIDVVLSALFSAFPGAIDSAVDCLADGVAKRSINAALAAALSALRTAPCKDFPPDDPNMHGLVQWNESGALQLLDSLLNAKTADFAARCLAGNAKRNSLIARGTLLEEDSTPLPSTSVSVEGLDSFIELSLLSGGDGAYQGALLESSGALETLTFTIRVSSSVYALDIEGPSWLVDAELAAIADVWYGNITVGDLAACDCKIQDALKSPPRLNLLRVNASNASWNVTGYTVDKAQAIASLLDAGLKAVSEIGDAYADLILETINRLLAERQSLVMDTCDGREHHSTSKKGDAPFGHEHVFLFIAVLIIVVVALIICYFVYLALKGTCRRGLSPTAAFHRFSCTECSAQEWSEERKASVDSAYDGSAASRHQALLSQCDDADDYRNSEALVDELLFSSEQREAPTRRCAFSWTSLAASANVPMWARCTIPILLCANIAFFVWSNCTNAASVDVELGLLENATGVGPITIHLGTLYKFSLTNSVRDMWRAGVYPLSVLIALCSGGWPYVKLISMLACWFAPESQLQSSGDQHADHSPDSALVHVFRMSPQRRENVLIWLDALGKWSLVDTFVMTLLTVAFHFKVSLGFSYGGGDFVDAIVVNVYVRALPSFFVFVAATCLSLVLGHAILALHRRDVKLKGELSRTDGNSMLSDKWNSRVKQAACLWRDTSYSLIQHAFEEDLVRNLHDAIGNGCSQNACVAPNHSENQVGDAEEQKRDDNEAGECKMMHPPSVLPVAVSLSAAAGLMLTVALICVGASTEGFDFDIRGAAGWIMGDDSKERYSMVSLGRDVPRASKHPHSAGALTLKLVYFVYALVFPLILPIALLVLWLIPMRVVTMRSVYRLCEVINAWAALDVFMIALLACITEISQFAAFMVSCILSFDLKASFWPGW